LRKHAAVPGIERVTTEDIIMNGYTIKAGQRCTLHLWCLHNNSHVWDEPFEFKPERFSPENVVKMDPFQFIPFSAGSRNCIGQVFAMNEMKATIAHMIQRFQFHLDTERPIRMEISITLKAEHGAFVFASPREK